MIGGPRGINMGPPVPGFLLCQPFPVRLRRKGWPKLDCDGASKRERPGANLAICDLPQMDAISCNSHSFCSLSVSLPLLSLLNVYDLQINSVIAPLRSRANRGCRAAKPGEDPQVPIISPTERAIDCTFHIGIAALLLQHGVRIPRRSLPSYVYYHHGSSWRSRRPSRPFV